MRLQAAGAKGGQSGTWRAPPSGMTEAQDRIDAAFFWLSLEIAAGRVVDLDAHLAFVEWTLQDIRVTARC